MQWRDHSGNFSERTDCPITAATLVFPGPFGSVKALSGARQLATVVNLDMFPVARRFVHRCKMCKMYVRGLQCQNTIGVDKALEWMGLNSNTLLHLAVFK